MLSYEDCKNIAKKDCDGFGATINKAFSIGKDYVFDNSEVEYMGILPIVVSSETGDCFGLWAYLNKEDLTMDDMQEIEF